MIIVIVNPTVVNMKGKDVDSSPSIDSMNVGIEEQLIDKDSSQHTVGDYPYDGSLTEDIDIINGKWLLNIACEAC